MATTTTSRPVRLDPRLDLRRPADARGRLLGELLRAGEIGYELSLDPRTPIVIGVYPMRPDPRGPAVRQASRKAAVARLPPARARVRRSRRSSWSTPARRGRSARLGPCQPGGQRRQDQLAGSPARPSSPAASSPGPRAASCRCRPRRRPSADCRSGPRSRRRSRRRASSTGRGSRRPSGMPAVVEPSRMKYADDATSPCSTTRVPARDLADRGVARRTPRAAPADSRANAPSRPASRSKSASVAGRDRAWRPRAGRRGRAAQPGARPRATSRCPDPGATSVKAADTNSSARREDDQQPDVDDVGQARAGHAEQEDDVAHDVERREHPAAHLARRVALEQHGARRPTTAS